MPKSYKANLKDITTFVFDIDGVLTDGTLLITSSGEQLRKMGVSDGFALKWAVKEGYHVCVISGGANRGVKERLKSLGVTSMYMETPDKLEALREFLDVYGISPRHVVYMGDDIPDLHAMSIVGLACCPQNAVPEIKAISKYISHRNGGEGCVRDIIEQVLKVRGHWPDTSIP